MTLNFKKYAEKAERMVEELAIQLGIPDRRDTAGRILRSVLHALRNRISLEESFQLMAQLPMALKSVYVEGWRPSKQQKTVRTIPGFIKEVMKEDGKPGRHDFSTLKDGENAIRAVFKVLENHVSEGEINHIRNAMPEELKDLW
ncbi:DUF2267 domain-containing protein [Fulvivirgaceae bacterium BMA10]|uniref:DUF2267 domain-containing protein n=1 Tax=Splendidivirga corallicola TaxID=3051826 RepID=A0ABT8KWB0_9BACT|nr:DUF2267 domain-containing protein [Fulvivirgaceae bacterium BMA10]